ncbi:MAG: L-lactate dehydrogenase, partial [Armatimonadota bacterium]|nr:L-lactate dehydrogenase [Armatimonadota bacterium]
MKVSIIGGAGRVGSNTAYALQLAGKVSEIALIDVMAEQAEGEALDLRHGASLASPQRFVWGGYEQAAGSDFVVITAGLRRKPDEPRLALINRNVDLFRSILAELRKVSLAPDAKLVVVANPVDILTQIAVKESGLPKERVIGTGTLLDTTRFRSFLGEHFKVAQTQVNALILGEHGDSMVPVWSTATINGVPLASFPGYREEEVRAIFDATKASGARVIALKGGAGYSIAVATVHLLNAMVLDTKEVLPVSTYHTGCMGIEDVCLSLPTVIGRKGVEGVVEMALWEKEKAALHNSARVLRETLDQVGA